MAQDRALAAAGSSPKNHAAPAGVVGRITPIAARGSDHQSNLQALGTTCNGRKGDR
jgi:hypothetical protein